MSEYDFSDLFILDIANNHNGSVQRAKEIINQHHYIPANRAVFKLQLRNLSTYIHPDYRESKQARRFLDTRLYDDDMKEIAWHVRKNGYMLATTPFDEDSVDLALSLQSDIIKIASCSAADWPLINVAAETGLPMVFSTGGLDISQIDNIVSFCEHKGIDFAIHHCVSIYPTSLGECALGRIAELKGRYPGITIGWSTHEDPRRTDIIKVAYALGARLFERHISIGEMNAYSSDPDQISEWYSAWLEVQQMMRPHQSPTIEKEAGNLAPLQRGKYPDGSLVIPARGTLEWDKGHVAPTEHQTPASVIKQAVHEIKAILNYAGVHLPPEWETEFSHHYGPLHFRSTGVTMVDIVNRHYAKKILIMLPGQHHPSHYHKIKDETFCLLWGDLTVDIDGKEHKLVPGEIITVAPGTWHSFWSEGGCVVEEVSTTSISGDSVYKDPAINNLRPDERKTRVTNWGRFQLEDALG